LESDLPVARRKEAELAKYYAWEAYWGAEWTGVESKEEEIEGNPNLHSAREVAGYRVMAIDGEIGHVDDFIMDDEAWENGPWEIRYLVIDTRNWLPGRHVLIPPLWAESIRWSTRTAQIGLTQKLIEESPEYDPNAPVNRQYEEVLYDYYGRPRYWSGSGHTA
jgi:hypothetical protein